MSANGAIIGYHLPKECGGGTIAMETLTVETILGIEKAYYGKAKDDEEASRVMVAIGEAKILKSFVGRNGKRIPEPEREGVYHGLGPKGVQLVKAAFHAQHNVTEEVVEDFLADGQPLEEPLR